MSKNSSSPAPEAKPRAPRSARPRDAAATKATILDCALREFAERGYDGARIERIVDAAGVNVSLAYQYFGSKEQMFIAVMEHIYGVMRTHHGDIEVRGLDPAAAMERLVRNTFRIFVKHPEIIGLLNSENVHRGKHIAKSSYIQKLYNPLLDTIAEVLKSGIDQGVFRSDCEAQDLFISLNGMGYFLLSNQYTLSVILGRNLSTPKALKRHEDHIVAVVLGYLRREGG